MSEKRYFREEHFKAFGSVDEVKEAYKGQDAELIERAVKFWKSVNPKPPKNTEQKEEK